MDNQPSRTLTSTGTMPSNKTVFATLLQYLTPDVYGTTIVHRNLLSPFNRHNRHFYRYRTSPLPGNKVVV